MNPTETDTAPTKRELLAKNVAHIRAHCSMRDAITFCVVETAELVLAMAEPKPEKPPVL